jgi:hypothetical protein
VSVACFTSYSLYANNVFIQTLAQIHMPIIAWASHDLRALKKHCATITFAKDLKFPLPSGLGLMGN